MPCGHCGFHNPTGFAFCGQCGASLLGLTDPFSDADLDHLRAYLPPQLVEAWHAQRTAPSPQLLTACVAHLRQLLDLTQSHLPSYLIERIARDPQPGRVDGHFIHGTLLFADISGFTALSETLSLVGLAGAEELTRIVNRYFNQMLTILRDHGGQLVKFGGDALLGLFIEFSGSLQDWPDSATRATQAARQMQEAMSAFKRTQTSRGVFKLQMKVAIRRGRFFAAQLGSIKGMDYALFGADVNATAKAEAKAKAGQIVLDRATLAKLTVPCKTTPLSADNSYVNLESIEEASTFARYPFISLTLSPEPTLANVKRLVTLANALTPYLTAGLLTRLTQGAQHLTRYGEHRLVAVLFANVRGLGELVDELGPGEETQIIAALNQYFTTMTECVQRFGGVINKLDLYEFGDKLLAFFGAPTAHADDAERAARAALAMQAQLKDLAGFQNPRGLRLTQHIGLTYGYVFAGYVGASWRREYTVMGDEVNLAARLMTTASSKNLTGLGDLSGLGRIAISSNAQRKTQTLFHFTTHAPVKLKGKKLLVPIFALDGVRAMPEPLPERVRSPLIGREREWGQLQAVIEQARAGRGQIVFLVGEAGLGKSRLVAELRQHSTDPKGTLRENPLGLTWVEGRCLSYMEAVSYWPLQDIVRQLVGIHAGDSDTESWHQLRATVADKLTTDDAEQLFPYLANFLNLSLSEDLHDKLRYLDAEALQRQTFVAVQMLLAASARATPLVVVCEDAHWMDQASQAWLERLWPLTQQTPLVLIVAQRAEAASRSAALQQKALSDFAAHTTLVTLQPLTADHSRQLLNQLAQFDQWPRELQARVLNHADGNPLYLEELWRTLADQPQLTRTADGRWQWSGSLDALQLPADAQGIIAERLGRVAWSCQETAMAAAVIGRIFQLDVLTQLMEGDGASLDGCLVHLQQHELVRETQRTPALVYAFKHALVQEVCYQRLAVQLRQQYHRKIAAQLEATHQASRIEMENMGALIAHHAYEGMDWRRALEYQCRAGEQAQRLYANHDALAHWRKALHNAEQLPPTETLTERQRIHAILGELLTTTDEFEQASQHLKAALTLAKEHHNPDAQAHAHRWLARVHELRAEFTAAFEQIELGLVTLGNRETEEAAQLRLMAGLIHAQQGRFPTAQAHAQNALDIAQRLKALRVWARAHSLMGDVLREQGDYAGAITHLQEAFDLYRQADDLQGQALTDNLLGNVYVLTGQWDLAEQSYQRARAVFQRLGESRRSAMTDGNLGEVSFKRGDLANAIARYEAALQTFQQIRVWRAVGLMHNNLGATLIRQGDVASARAHLREAQAHFTNVAAHGFLPELHQHLAEAALAVGELDEAYQESQQALALARQFNARGEEGYSLRVLGEVALARGELEAAEAYLNESIGMLQELNNAYECARSELALARVQLAHNDTAQGRLTLERSIAVFERLGAQWDLAMARTIARDN